VDSARPKPAQQTNNGNSRNSRNTDFNDFADADDWWGQDQSQWHAMHQFCLQHLHLLRARETEFVVSLENWRGELTPKQEAWLTAIYNRLKRQTSNS
jgi:hypothetical protein